MSPLEELTDITRRMTNDEFVQKLSIINPGVEPLSPYVLSRETENVKLHIFCR